MSDVLQLRSDAPEKFEQISAAASAKRFTWDASAASYLGRLYT